MDDPSMGDPNVLFAAMIRDLLSSPKSPKTPITPANRQIANVHDRKPRPKSPENLTLAPTLSIKLSRSSAARAPPSVQAMTNDLYWKCGRCSAEPWLMALYLRCLDCEHTQCTYDCTLLKRKASKSSDGASTAKLKHVDP